MCCWKLIKPWMKAQLYLPKLDWQCDSKNIEHLWLHECTWVKCGNLHKSTGPFLCLSTHIHMLLLFDCVINSLFHWPKEEPGMIAKMKCRKLEETWTYQEEAHLWLHCKQHNKQRRLQQDTLKGFYTLNTQVDFVHLNTIWLISVR